MAFWQSRYQFDSLLFIVMWTQWLEVLWDISDVQKVVKTFSWPEGNWDINLTAGRSLWYHLDEQKVIEIWTWWLEALQENFAQLLPVEMQYTQVLLEFHSWCSVTVHHAQSLCIQEWNSSKTWVILAWMHVNWQQLSKFSLQWRLPRY
jgi:hypothetical protein